MSNNEEPNTEMITQQAHTVQTMDHAVAEEFGSIEPPVPPKSPPMEAAEPAATAELVKGVVYLKNGAQLPTGICVKSGKRASTVIKKTLRDPFNPMTWFGKREQLQLGLTKKHHENLMIARALTWAGVAVAGLIVVAGISSLSVGMIVGGVVVAFAMSPIRSFLPVWVRTRKGSDDIELHGVGKAFVDQISWD